MHSLLFFFSSGSRDISLVVVNHQASKLIDAGRNDPPYNKNSYPAYDPMNLYEGEYTPLDKMFHEKEKSEKSDNPMDVNWGGMDYTNSVIDSGYYAENT